MLFGFTNAFHFYLKNGQQECFPQESPKDYVIKGTYQLEEYNVYEKRLIEDQSLSAQITVDDLMNNNRIMNHVGSNKGRFSYTVVNGGRHNVCFYVKTKNPNFNPNNKIRVTIDMALKEDDDPNKAKAKMSILSQTISSLNFKLNSIREEQKYQLDRETQFRETNRAINTRIVFWAIVQFALIGVVCYWQLRHLRRFFEAKKLVYMQLIKICRSFHFISPIGWFSVQTAALVGKAAFGAAGTLALKHVSQYLKNAPKSSSRKNSDLKTLKSLFETKLRAIMPAIDLIEIMTARGNSVMKTILPLTNSLRKDIESFCFSLERMEIDEINSQNLSHSHVNRKISSKSTLVFQDITSKLPLDSNYPKILEDSFQESSNQGSDQYSDQTERICSELKMLLSKIDQAVPLLNLALATSGINLGGSLPTGISTSRLLQASSFIVSTANRCDSYLKSPSIVPQNSKNPSKYKKKLNSKSSKKINGTFHSKPIPPPSNTSTKLPRVLNRNNKCFAVSEPFNLKLYTLFSGSARSKSLSDFTWKENFPRCQIQLFRTLNSDQTNSFLEKNTTIESLINSFSYSLTCTQNLNDGRYHEDLDYNLKDPKSDFLPGKAVTIDVSYINKLYFSSSGTLLNIEGSNSPVLVLQIKSDSLNKPKKNPSNLKKSFSNLKINSNSTKDQLSEDSSSDSSDEFLEDEKSNRYDGFIWLALQADNYDPSDDSGSDYNSDYYSDSDSSSKLSESENPHKSHNLHSSDPSNHHDDTSFSEEDYQSNEESIKHHLKNSNSHNNNHSSDDHINDNSENTPFSVDEWSLSSLSLLECLLRLATAETSLQKSHLEIPDEQLMLFLSGSHPSSSKLTVPENNLKVNHLYNNSIQTDISWSSSKVKNQTPISKIKKQPKLDEIDKLMFTPLKNDLDEHPLSYPTPSQKALKNKKK
ncbi:putative membrane protein [Smittium mucronatum]|uniref:Putative membrane protein n=1 Tax=Smittium mucronatum TaxID=133383 RepID=A0A1R0H0W3_9FUNG|nr:putative membrane protein [Smittium mucronatum]